MSRLQQDIDDLDRMVDGNAAKDEIRSQIRLISRGVAALEAADYERLEQIAQIIHDGDLEDNKFGRAEGKAIELITKGWGKMDWSDEEILRKGFELFDALYLTIGT